MSEDARLVYRDTCRTDQGLKVERYLVTDAVGGTIALDGYTLVVHNIARWKVVEDPGRFVEGANMKRTHVWTVGSVDPLVVDGDRSEALAAAVEAL